MHWAWIRIAAALAGFTGVVAGFIVNIDRATREGQDVGLVLANYFSLFTILTTSLGIIALLVAARWLLKNPGTSPEPLGIGLALAAVAGPTLLLGLVFNLLLRAAPSGIALEDSAWIAFLDSYATEVLHVVLPIYFLIDILFATRRRALPWWSLAVLVGYPLLWTAYTMVRGELVSNPDGSTPWWYPYPFLDPHGAGGYGSAFMYIGGILAGFLVIGSLIILVSRFRATRAAARTAPRRRGAFPA